MEILKDFLNQMPMVSRVIVYAIGLVFWTWFVFLYPTNMNKDNIKGKFPVQNQTNIGKVEGDYVVGDKYVSELKDKGTTQQSAITRLDGHSLGLLAQINGLTFVPKDLDIGTIQRLIDLNLVAVEVFPSDIVTYGYYLTDEGRDILSKKLARDLYPEIFCDLMRIGFWNNKDNKDYEPGFIKRKNEFRKKYNVSWDDSWKVLESLLGQKVNIHEGGVIYMFNSFASDKSFETIMNQVVNPWLSKINKES